CDELERTNDELYNIYDCFLEGMSYRSIADYLGISISNVHAKRSK
ncbi:MAG TPA: hypothetical protein DDY89_19470, partial [Lysinibacillus sp.]|nr:hypothetical protein [Lysinibacillus sp.]